MINEANLCNEFEKVKIQADRAGYKLTCDTLWFYLGKDGKRIAYGSLSCVWAFLDGVKSK